MKTINIIQDLATPHNNKLIEALNLFDEKVAINLWYAEEVDKSYGLYNWKKNITHDHGRAEIYGFKLNLLFIWNCLRKKDEVFFIVGWMNNNTRLLILLFFLLRRPFNFYTDRPNDIRKPTFILKRIIRWLSYFILKHSKSKIFCVGKTAISYFKKRSFSTDRLVNLPIFVESHENLDFFASKKDYIFKKINLNHGDFNIVGASRLIFDKGYDILLKAFASINENINKRMKLIIVGNGEEEKALKLEVYNLNIGDRVIFINWMEMNELKMLIYNADIFVHPARFDAYGGTTVAMALKKAVIGSYGAGAAVDRIIDKKNGLLYDPLDYMKLRDLIEKLHVNPILKNSIETEALKTAKSWPPNKGAKIIINNVI